MLFHFCKAPFIQPSLLPWKRWKLPWQSQSPWQCTTQQDITVSARTQPTKRTPCGITGKPAGRFCVCKHITALIGLSLEGRMGRRRSQKSKQQENRIRKELRGKNKTSCWGLRALLKQSLCYLSLFQVQFHLEQWLAQLLINLLQVKVPVGPWNK